MVSLAKKLEDQPFHLIASYCQHGTKQDALNGLLAEGWSEKEVNNISVSLATVYPKLMPQIKYVPYYLIFDHTGKLRHHHMAGRYHGGNGDKYQEQVLQLLKEIPKEK